MENGITLREYLLKIWHQGFPPPECLADLNIVEELKNAELGKDAANLIINTINEVCDRLTSINMAEKAIREEIQNESRKAKKGAKENNMPTKTC